MSNYTSKIITSDVVQETILTIFKDNDEIFRIKRNKEAQLNIAKGVVSAINDGNAIMTVTYNEDNEPVAMYVGFKFPNLKAWVVGLTKVAGKYNHYNQSAAVMAPAMDLLITTMEEQSYFKFWMVAPEQHHDIRNKVMKKHSSTLGRYHCYDEDIIPQGALSETEIYNAYRGRNTIDWTDMLVRLFVLNQSQRVKYLKQKGRETYKGNLNISRVDE